MSFDVNQLDYGLIAPELILLGLIFLAWLLDLFLPRGQKRWIGWISIVGLVAGIVASAARAGTTAAFAGVLRIDSFTIFFEILFMATAIGITLISMEYADRFLPQPGEYYGLVLSGTLGMVLMAAANELLTAYLSLELLSFSSYVLVSYAKTNLKSNEAGMKYIILGAFSSALLLYGISLLYGSLGSTYFPDLAAAVGRLTALPAGFNVGLVLILAGLGFKIAAVPFHMWTPDVYEGAPTPVTAYLSVASKAAGFALVMRFLVGGLLPLQDAYQTVFALLAVLTMTLGNLVAIQQRNIKRLLAYSSIGQAGYVLVGLAAFSRNPDIATQASTGMILHLTGYVATNLAAFGAVIAYQNLSGGRELIADMAGLGRRAPFVALVMTVALFSLAGMPLFAGFVTKFYLFAAAARAELLWLVAIAVLNSLISLYYYLLVVYQMYVVLPPGFAAVDDHGHGAAHEPGGGPLSGRHEAEPALALALAGAGAGARGGVAVLTAGDSHSGVVSHGGAAHVVSANGRGSDGHAGAAAHGAGGDGLPEGPSGDWWRRDINADMPPERAFPAYRVPWVTSVGLLLFLAGIFFMGLWPTPLIGLAREASRALFAG